MARSLVLTTGLGGADGIARASALVVRALAAGAEPGAEVDVLSLGERSGAPPPPSLSTAVRLRGAGGSRAALLTQAIRCRLGRRAARVVCLHLHLSPVARLAARSAPLSVYLHGIEAWQPVRPRERHALARADLLLANSAWTARRFAAANPELADRPLRVCHLAVADGDGSAGAEVSGAPPFALIVGRMAARERYKGHDVLLDVWPRLASEVPDAWLVVVGDGDDRARLERRAAALGGRVSFAGPVSDTSLARLYRECAFFAMPSRDEGFGLVFLEAMRAGKACVGAVGAAAEVIEDGVSGLLVDPADPAQVLNALARLFRDPDERARMGRAGAARVARHFTEAEFRRRFRALLDEKAAPR